MTVTLGLLTLLHLLIPIYWLGGDLGAFYSSGFMLDPKRSVAERMMAVKILVNIDMAPRTALILAFPTGLTLAWAKGWLELSGVMVAVGWIGFLAWLALAWAVHLNHGPAGQPLRRLDLAVRYAVLAALLLAGIAALAGTVAMPLFITLKLLILAACIALGLLVRRQLGPLFPAIAQMRESGPTAASDQAMAGVISRTRPTVILLWVMILIASYLGIATPS
jgi:hypothetical protein